MATAAAQYRTKAKAGSNNAANPNKNICALAAARYFGVEDATRYLHTDADLRRAVGKRFSVRSVKSSCAVTVGGSRAALRKIAEDRGALAFIAIVEGHVLVLNKDGETVIDTAPRKIDRRKIKKIHGVYRKEGPKLKGYRIETHGGKKLITYAPDLFTATDNAKANLEDGDKIFSVVLAA